MGNQPPDATASANTGTPRSMAMAATYFYIDTGTARAVDGVSLTIAAVEGGLFSLALIPTTLELTTFGKLTKGRRVNLESDILARTIVQHLQAMSTSGGLDMESLLRAGFV